MRISIVLLLVVTLAGCANIKVDSPGFYKIDKARQYKLSYNTVWIQVVDWFADHNVTIDKIEKTSGLITAKYHFEVGDEYLDCGNIESSGTREKPVIHKVGTLNVTIRELDSATTKVNVNFFGGFVLEAQDSWDGRQVEIDGRCVSMGVVEQSVLDSVQ